MQYNRIFFSLLMLLFTVTESVNAQTPGGGGPGGGGPVVEICYVQSTLHCGLALYQLVYLEDEPIQIGCGECEEIAPDDYQCNDEGSRGVVPEEQGRIDWVDGLPKSTGTANGKEEFKSGTETVCGTVKECTGCKFLVGQAICDSVVKKEWKIFSRVVDPDAPDCHGLAPIN